MSTMQLINPATEDVLRSVDHVDAAAVDDAVARARVAQRRWARLSPADRAAGLRAFAAAVDAHIDELAALEVANSGHPIASAEWEAGHVRDVLQFYAASPERNAAEDQVGFLVRRETFASCRFCFLTSSALGGLEVRPRWVTWPAAVPRCLVWRLRLV